MAGPGPSFQIPQVLVARVVGVEGGTAHLRTEHGEDDIPGVPIASPYGNAARGQGMYFKPERGSLCYVILGSDGEKFVGGFVRPMGKGEGRTGGTPELNEGDGILLGRKGALVILRASGAIEIMADSMTHSLWIPTGHLVKQVFGNLEWQSPLGTLMWKEGDSGAAMMEFAVHDKSRAPEAGKANVYIRAGTVSGAQHEPGSTKLTTGGKMFLEILAQSGSGSKLFGFHVDDSGQFSLGSEKNGYLRIAQCLEVKVDDTLKMVLGKGGLDLSSLGPVKMAATSFEATGPNGAPATRWKASAGVAELEAGKVSLGKLPTESPVLLTQLVTWLASTGKFKPDELARLAGSGGSKTVTISP